MTHHENPEELAEHLVATGYQTLSQLLLDAQRVAIDLRSKCAGQLVVPANELDFLTARLYRLIEASRDSLPVHERPVPKR